MLSLARQAAVPPPRYSICYDRRVGEQIETTTAMLEIFEECWLLGWLAGWRLWYNRCENDVERFTLNRVVFFKKVPIDTVFVATRG